MKQCTKCKIFKKETEFYKQINGKYGLCAHCKVCHSKMTKEAHNKILKQNPWLTAYCGARARCNNKNNPKYSRYGERGIKLLMTKDDFKFLWFRDKAYLMKKPSIDRIDNDGNYELSNCRFIEFLKNRPQTNKNSVCVMQFKGNKLIKAWKSLHEAERKLGIAYQNIWKCVNNKRKTAGGFEWKKVT